MPDDSPIGIDLVGFTQKLIDDLDNLRVGKISVHQARASAELARQILRSMSLIVTAQKLIESRALPLSDQTKS